MLICIIGCAPAHALTKPGTCTPCGFEPEAKGLEKLLKQYKELASNGGWPEWDIGPKILPHTQDRRIATLRQVLIITGDYKGVPAEAGNATRFDDTLVAAVKQFQLRHGLNPDGTLGKSTQEALAVPIETRIREIEGTIARIRTRIQAHETRFVLVNLPAFALYAVNNGTATLSMRVVIGSVEHQTPLFDNIITNVIFNPQWRVPDTIAQRELVPKLFKDPAYFVHSGFVVMQDGKRIDPMHADPDDSGKLSFRQLAGDENALGKVKFYIPDADNIYLHSTAAPQLFSHDARALSHGCVRVEAPRELAYFMFQGSKEWDHKRIDDAYDDDTERWAKVDAVPVHLVYWTAFLDAEGLVHFYSDVYGLDEPPAPEKPKKK